jgi:L-aspartate oxidase
MKKDLNQQGQHLAFDVLVIGTGMAGLYYCLKLLELQPKLRIAILNKASAYESNSIYAQGGIAAVASDEDALESHVKDTLKAGDGLCYPSAVECIVHQGPDLIRQLERYALNFSKQDNGQYQLAREGGHSHRRILNCGDQTGLTMTEALEARLRQFEQVHFFEHHIAINLICHYHPHRSDNQGEVLGAYVLDAQANKIHTMLANCTVLATGGAGKTYRYTSNPMVATGDGVAMAYRAGARIGNMEFYQFHPTLLHHHSLNNFLISEAVRGEGALLINPGTNERFMKRYAPEMMELATRDIVARAIFNEIESSEAGYVCLDITHKSKSFLQQRFPKIFNTLMSIGIDMSQDQIPVIPAAHYQCGGILTDVDGQTDLKRLYAIGEVAFTGLHGANRLASNSLLEALAMGQNAANRSLKDCCTFSKAFDTVDAWNSPSEVNRRRASQINAHWRGLRGEMTSYAGIVRTEAGLEDILQLILIRKKVIEDYYWNHAITSDFIELRNIVLNAELIVRSALARRESRGGHYREDFPQKNSLAKESIMRQTSPLSP